MSPAKEELTKVLATLPKGVKIVYKEGTGWKFLAGLIKVLSFGSERAFLNYTTTFYKTIAVPSHFDMWEDEHKLETIVHELEHVKQAMKLTPVLFWFLYFLFPLPIGLAWFRYKFERDAYLVGYKTILKYEFDKESLIEEASIMLSGKEYGYAWPFRKKIAAWFRSRL